ncbi:tetratricopeptide repeat protein [Bradyrhizobium sp. LHD-71]|uniref:tetratricopeptide repeat protein n=1 Tax=Bradyrhizobium sp. LHD-71 TaxID=3072141 RepID=UPI00280EE000|nr:tetratricopeptide repeat protein [Bradyrhizobium sp. LHD-71]MDQ8727006.1 tetratricopeptide repeat protein [Bradyrhizobium sp. LHD-71]
MAAISTGGCSSIIRDVTSSVATKAAPQSEADWRKAIDTYGERYRTNPKDAQAALRYGTALRATGQHAQSSAVLEQAAMANPGDRTLLAAYGRALVDNGSYQQGFDTLSRAHTPDNPDWHILSIQGTALDRLGRHEDARRYYENALKIQPNEPSVLSNLGMSYVLSKELPKAEDALRRAHAGAPSDARIRQNLALAIGLQGRFPEAESIITAGLPPDEAAESVKYLKQMLQGDGRKPAIARAETQHASRT